MIHTELRCRGRSAVPVLYQQHIPELLSPHATTVP
jgi:hypothetical protein